MIPPRWLLWALTSTRDHSYSAFPIMWGHMNSLPPFLSLAYVAGTKWTQSCLHLSEMMGSDLQQKKGVEKGRAHSSLLPRDGPASSFPPPGCFTAHTLPTPVLTLSFHKDTQPTEAMHAPIRLALPGYLSPGAAGSCRSPSSWTSGMQSTAFTQTIFSTRIIQIIV